ncbi:hypothetical protein [Hyphomonas sp.]|jgi:hypothetical protein|uniref:hypothetical protein n=1 Tax=Hyphomonas sp. TaxID=87 RepID=UPI0037C0D96D
MSKIITVDFDETLAISTISGWGGNVLIPVERVVDFIKLKINEGFKIFIVTFRPEKDKQEIVNFCKYHEIKIEDIICTDGKTKTKFIKELNSSLHIDDHVETCTLCVMAGIEVLLVDWNQDENNTTAKFFNKI